MSDSSNPHLAVLQANQRRKDEEAAAAAAATQESEQRQQRQEDAARARETQEEVVQGHLNPHALIIARQAARLAEEERKEKEAAAEKERKAAERRAKQEAAQAAAAKEKEEETKRKTAEAKKAEPKLATHTGLLLVLEDKTKWSERLVELKDGENYPTLSFYAGATAEATFLREEVLIGGSVVVKAETSLPSNSSGVLTLSLRKEKPHPFAFAFAINRKVYTLEAHTEEDRDTWKRHLGLYAGKYHDPAAAAALATSDAADGDSGNYFLCTLMLIFFLLR